MIISFTKGDINHAPKGYARIRLTEEVKTVRREVRENSITWIEIGTGPWNELDRRKFILACRRIIRAARISKTKKIAVEIDLERFPHLRSIPSPELGSLVAQNFEMANFEYTAHKSKPKEGWDDVEEVLVCGAVPASMQEGFKKGQLVGQGVNACRTLANTPGGDMTPTVLAKAAKDAAKGLPIKVTVLGRKDMEKIGMGSLLGVAKGSSEEPTFTVMEYRGAPGKPIVLVGKGVTFDSGGLNLKPASGIYEMHMDMSGAAAVLHVVVLAARLKLKKHIIALVPAVENMPGSEAYRPGDILKSLSGKTIEVLNTDAEGRLILADALTYAKRLKPSVVIDVATLTGAAVSALGLHATALLTRDDALAESLLSQGEAAGDYLWRLPLWDEYEDLVSSNFADLANVASGASARYGGAIEGGMFLWQFAKELECPWAHLDIAPRMTTTPSDELAKGAAGTPVRALVRFIHTWNP